MDLAWSVQAPASVSLIFVFDDISATKLFENARISCIATLFQNGRNME